MNTPQSIHKLTLKGLKGNEINFSDYAGKKILLVNVASECGLTPQYAQLEEMYREFSDKFVIVGCPANNFGGQEPGSNEDIEKFCRFTYHISFPMTTKISVKGDDKHYLYSFVTEKAQNGVQDSEVSWNFQKYVFDEQGFLTHVFDPQTEPASDEVLSALGVSA
ncbi:MULTISPECIES: glutathione peroxidase [unclassified Aureispira]|uniref:glutathione peroxidase n=1 Tax=unclassified Aureispira TaxID=2649989 RepID=UPI0006981216|nr:MULTISPECIES: glutathione peroxidase [unclassified Aureispira]WMX14714.1 glutathione peroxidase [Aureispira sp. CCB-E]